MGWKKLGEELKKRREVLNASLTLISIKTNISTQKLQAMENGDFEVDTPFYVKEYLKRLADVLFLDYESLLREYVEELFEREKERKAEDSNKKFFSNVKFLVSYVLIGILSFMIFFLAVKIVEIVTSPYAFIENRTDGIIYVDNRPLKPGDVLPLFKNVTVEGNKGTVVIRESSGRTVNVKIKDFEVMIRGRGEGP